MSPRGRPPHSYRVTVGSRSVEHETSAAAAIVDGCGNAGVRPKTPVCRGWHYRTDRWLHSRHY